MGFSTDDTAYPRFLFHRRRAGGSGLLLHAPVRLRPTSCIRTPWTSRLQKRRRPGHDSVRGGVCSAAASCLYRAHRRRRRSACRRRVRHPAHRRAAGQPRRRRATSPGVLSDKGVNIAFMRLFREAKGTYRLHHRRGRTAASPRRIEEPHRATTSERPRRHDHRDRKRRREHVWISQNASELLALCARAAAGPVSADHAAAANASWASSTRDEVTQPHRRTRLRRSCAPPP